MVSIAKHRLRSISFLLLLIGVFPSYAQQIDILMDGELDCTAKTYCVPVQLQTSTTAQIGTSSIFIDYNENALAFKSYTSTTFDGTSLCIAGVANAWDPQAFDGTSVPGDFNLTLTLLNNVFSCPEITSTPVEVGVICFDILDEALNPNISVNTANTQFNGAATNDGSSPIAVGSTSTISGAAIDCSQPCITAGGDSDNDGICNTDDQCPNFDDRLLGQACDDGDPCTTGETYNNCGCSGGTTSSDSDSDGVCDTQDRCPNDPTNNCVPDYCLSEGTITAHEHIKQVILNTINSNSGRDGYGNYVSMNTSLQKGQSYDMTLVPDFGNNGTYPQHWTVWIDYNQDGDFDDPNEMVLSQSSTASINDSITIPSSGVLNGSTVMRVTMQWGTAPSNCGDICYGEVEDYSVTIQ